MKKIFIFLFICGSLLSKAQEPFKLDKQQKKNIKFSIVTSSVCIAAGALTTVIKTYQSEPINKDLTSYKQGQRDLERVSAMFYGLAGISLVTIVFNF